MFQRVPSSDAAIISVLFVILLRLQFHVYRSLLFPTRGLFARCGKHVRVLACADDSLFLSCRSTSTSTSILSTLSLTPSLFLLVRFKWVDYYGRPVKLRPSRLLTLSFLAMSVLLLFLKFMTATTRQSKASQTASTRRIVS
jgi:hypothetical protein